MPPRHWFDAEAEPAPEAHAARGMVACANAWAAQAGVDILRAGGNAVDAAIAAQLVLNVVEPQSSGLGGGAFMMIWEPGPEPGVVFLDGREEAPAAMTSDVFLTEKGEPIKFWPTRITGGRAVGVPGTPALLFRALNDHGSGKLSFAALAAAAIKLADEGFPVSERLAGSIRSNADRLARFEPSRAIFLHADGSPLRTGERLRNPDLAATLRLLGEEGAKAYYQGPVAEDIVATVQGCPVAPGSMTLEDLARYRAVRRAPVHGQYRGFDIWGVGPPSSGGTAVLEILQILEGWDLSALQAGSVEEIHLLAEASRLTFADRERHLGDADFVDTSVSQLTSADFAARRRQRIDATRATPSPVPAEIDTEGTDTTHLSVVDSQRRMVAFTTTIEQGWGSASVVRGRGFLLNNELTDFSARPTLADGKPHPNRPEGGKRPRRTALDAPELEGGKRPRSSMSPTLVLRDGKPRLTVGSPGGSRIIGIVAQTLINVIDHGMDIQAAIDFPRAFNRNGNTDLEWLYFDDPMLSLRTGARRTAVRLRAMGHTVRQPSRRGRAFGGAHGVWISADGTRLEGGADPRREGVALGW